MPPTLAGTSSSSAPESPSGGNPNDGGGNVGRSVGGDDGEGSSGDMGGGGDAMGGGGVTGAGSATLIGTFLEGSTWTDSTCWPKLLVMTDKVMFATSLALACTAEGSETLPSSSR